jgi:hypothetical protein
MPVEKLTNGSWPHASRLPLGCGWHGHCTAPGHEGEVPLPTVLEAFCNLGYASGCTWAPRERPWDAVRFAISAPQSGRPNESGKAPVPLIRIGYVCERSHRPADHGELEFDLQQSTWRCPHPDRRLQKMAECFLEAYLSRRS